LTQQLNVGQQKGWQLIMVSVC